MLDFNYYDEIQDYNERDEMEFKSDLIYLLNGVRREINSLWVVNLLRLFNEMGYSINFNRDGNATDWDVFLEAMNQMSSVSDDSSTLPDVIGKDNIEDYVKERVSHYLHKKEKQKGEDDE